MTCSGSRLGDTSIFSSAQAACSSLLYKTCSSVLGMAASGGDEGGPVTSVTSERPCERGCGRASFRHYNTCVLIKDGDTDFGQSFEGNYPPLRGSKFDS